MKRRCLLPVVKLTFGSISAVLVTGLATVAQSPPGTAAGQAAPSSPALGQLEQQVQELSSALREMRAEMAAAHSEAEALKQELGQTRVELQALKGDLASTQQGKEVSSSPEVKPSQTSTNSEPQVESRMSKLEEAEQLLGSEIGDQD